jgi:hypothetical protein
LRFFNSFVSLKKRIKRKKKEKKGARERENFSLESNTTKMPDVGLFYPHLVIGVALFFNGFVSLKSKLRRKKY